MDYLVEKSNDQLRIKGDFEKDIVVDISRKDIGFGSDDNEVVLLDKNGGVERLEKASKSVIARKILEYINE